MYIKIESEIFPVGLRLVCFPVADFFFDAEICFTGQQMETLDKAF